jgi:hypothetical protein
MLLHPNKLITRNIPELQAAAGVTLAPESFIDLCEADDFQRAGGWIIKADLAPGPGIWPRSARLRLFPAA